MTDFSPDRGGAGSDDSGTRLISVDDQDSLISSKRVAGVGLPPTHSGLFLKYVVMFVAIVSLALAINGASDIWFSYHEQQDLLVRIQREQVKSAVDKIGQFLNEITAG